MFQKANAGWAVMPCCIWSEANDARLVRKISRDIMARPIIIAEWGMLSDRSSCAGEEGGGSRDSLEFVVKQGAMPPL
eukprot:1882404-Ditylum_brightwellii.AAC.1